jgi:hypothetical protein
MPAFGIYSSISEYEGREEEESQERVVSTYHNIDSTEPCRRKFEQRNLFVPLRDITLDRNRFPAGWDDHITVVPL